MRAQVGLCFAMALAAATVPATAGAATIITGLYDANSQVFETGNVNLGPGRYRFSLSTTTPILNVDSRVEKTTNTDYFCDFNDGAGEVSCGGDDVPTETPLTLVTPTLYQASVRVFPPVSQPVSSDPFTRYVESETCCSYQLSFDTGEAGRYTFSFAAVPEPATWATLILGMGVVGGALRRRRTGALAAAR